MENVASLIATAALAVSLYFTSLRRLKAERNPASTRPTSTDFEALTAKVTEIETENARLTGEVNSLTSDNTRMSEKIETMTTDLRVLRKDNRDTINELTAALRDLLKARQELAEADAKNRDLAGRNERLETDKATLVSANQNLADQLKESTKALNESQSANNTAKQTIEELKLQLAQLAGERDGLAKGYSMMQFKLVQSKEVTEEKELTNDH